MKHLPSLFIAAAKHLLRRQARHWLRCVLSIGHFPLRSPVALHVYTLLRWMLLLKNPEHPVEREEYRFSNSEASTRFPVAHYHKPVCIEMLFWIIKTTLSHILTYLPHWRVWRSLMKFVEKNHDTYSTK